MRAYIEEYFIIRPSIKVNFFYYIRQASTTYDQWTKCGLKNLIIIIWFFDSSKLS